VQGVCGCGVCGMCGVAGVMAGVVAGVVTADTAAVLDGMEACIMYVSYV
jgi:hypothetical protein